MNTFALSWLGTGLRNTHALQPMSPIVPAPAAQPAPMAQRSASTSGQRHGRLPDHYRRYILLMLASNSAQRVDAFDPAGRHVLDPIFKQVCAQAVVLLERMDPAKLKQLARFQMGETPPWSERQLLMILFRLLLRYADENGGLHDGDTYWRLLSAVVPVRHEHFNVQAFVQEQELRLLKDIGFAAYVTPEKVAATERRLDRWLSIGPQALLKLAEDHPDAGRIATLLAKQLAAEADVLRPAIEERERAALYEPVSPLLSVSPVSPASPMMPTTPRWRGVPDLAALLERRALNQPKDGSRFELRPPPMPEDVLGGNAAPKGIYG